MDGFARRGDEFGAAKRLEDGCCGKRAMSCNGLPLIAWREEKFFVGQVEVRTCFLDEISDFFQIVAFGLPNGLFTGFYEPECRFEPEGTVSQFYPLTATTIFFAASPARSELFS